MNATAKTTDRAVPEWLDTPEHQECEYLLTFQDAEGAQDHSVEMTRAEFEELKRHLAEMRGFEVEAEPDSVNSAAKVTTVDVYRKEILELLHEHVAFRLGDDDSGGSWGEPSGEDRTVFYMMLQEVQDQSETDGAKPRLLAWADTLQRHAQRIRAAYSGGSAAA